MSKLSALIFILMLSLGVTVYGQSGSGGYGGSESGSGGSTGTMGSDNPMGGGTGGTTGTSGSMGGTDSGTTGTGGTGGGSYGPTDTGGGTGTSGATNTGGVMGPDGSSSPTGTGGSTGGTTDTGGTMGTGTSTSTMGVGGTTGGAGDVSSMKKDYQLRLDQVDTQISDMKKSMKDMSSGMQKDAMNRDIKDVKTKRDSVKKMIGDMQTTSDSSKIENELSGLEQQVKTMSSGTQRSMPAGEMDTGSSMTDQGGATGGAAVSTSTGTQKTQKKTKKAAGSSVSKSTHTATGGGTGGASADISAMKKDMKDRVTAVDKEIRAAKDSAKEMTPQQKDAQMMKISKVEGQRDGVKKMIDSMTTKETASKVESALADLEQSAKNLVSTTQRSTPAGDKQDGTGTPTSTGSMTGGATGGAVMEYSYDQRDEFYKYEKTRFDSYVKRIDSLRSVAKSAPQNINSQLSPKVDELYGMKNDVEDKIVKLKNTDRNNWNTAKANSEKGLNDLEKKIMDAEKYVK